MTGIPGTAATRTARSSRGLLLLLPLVRRHKGILLEGILAAVLSTALGMATSLYIQVLVDDVLVNGDVRELNLLGMTMVALALLRSAFGYFRFHFLMHLGQKVDAALFRDFCRHLLNLPLRFFEGRQTGELISRLNDTAKLREFLTLTLAILITDVTTVIAAVAVMAWYDPVLTGIVLCVVPVLAANAVGLRRRYEDSVRETRGAYERLSSSVIEFINGIETAKALTAERAMRERAYERMLLYYDQMIRTQLRGIRATSFSIFVTVVAGLLVLWVGGYRVIRGDLTIGQLLGFNALTFFVFPPLERLVNANLAVYDGRVAVQRLFEILGADVEAPPGQRRTVLKKCRGEIALQDVSFGYEQNRKILDSVSVHVHAGETVALVGESGSGKSTVLRLIQGFVTPDQGTILVDGWDLRLLTPGSLRRHMGSVPQETFLFTGTIAENISLGCDAYPDMARVVQAARQACVHEAITGLPQSYLTVLAEKGTRLSSGERQRIAIARALYRNSPIMILDEVTSALDARAEEAVRNTLKKLQGEKTILVAAHRLSTITHADRILVLANGLIVEEGRHDTLLANRGRYWDFWRRHLGREPAPA